MNRLTEIIPHLNQNIYDSVEGKLIKSKADNFLYALREYREGKQDIEILKKLNLNHNSFYVLKSRLHDRIQEQLTEGTKSDKNFIYSNLEKIDSISYQSVPSLAISFLEKLAADLLSLEMYGELLYVYSALKKLHYNTERYFHYSHLYNKHAAYWFSIEKANEILNDFNFALQQYDFSKKTELMEKLQFLNAEIRNHYNLNPSSETGIIMNVIEMQLHVFCDIPLTLSSDMEDLLKETYAKTKAICNSNSINKWETVLNHLSFEYYFKNNRNIKADEYYEKTNSSFQNLMLHSNLSLVGKFLSSKIEYLNSRNQTYTLRSECLDQLAFNEQNFYQNVSTVMYKAIRCYLLGETKKSIGLLNGLLNDNCFKNSYHIYLEIKLILATCYLSIEQYDLAESIVTSIYRKIKSDEFKPYISLHYLIRFFNLILKRSDDQKMQSKIQECMMLFSASNTGEFKILNQLQSELKIISIKNVYEKKTGNI